MSAAPRLAAAAFRAGLVDEVHLFLHPVVVGGGTRALPDDVHAALDLVAVDRIGEVVHLHHRLRRARLTPARTDPTASDSIAEGHPAGGSATARSE